MLHSVLLPLHDVGGQRAMQLPLTRWRLAGEEHILEGCREGISRVRQRGQGPEVLRFLTGKAA